MEVASRPSAPRGTLKATAKCDLEKLQSRARKIRSHEISGESLLQTLQQSVPDEQGIVTIHNKYGYSHGVRTRRYLLPDCHGSQKISRRLRAAATENVEEWDVENAHFAIASQFPERVGFKLDHPVTKLPGITAYVCNRERVLSETAINREEAKTLLLSTLNGARVPAEMANVEISRQI